MNYLGSVLTNKSLGYTIQNDSQDHHCDTALKSKTDLHLGNPFQDNFTQPSG